MSELSNAQASKAAEFSFKNAVLKSGKANQDGAVYLFSNVATGVDATVTIVGRSGPEVILDTIDVPPAGGMGFDKALQPQLGMHGTAPARSKWWMKFKVNFLQAGTTKAMTVSKFSASAIDVDGDNLTIAENVNMGTAISETVSTYSVLTGLPQVAIVCPKEKLPSLAIPCLECLGLGYRLKNDGSTQDCSRCKGAGKVFALCNHPWTGSDIYKQGTTVNAAGIDTLAINNMVTFTYLDTDEITFTYGATMGDKASTAAERLNSMYFKSFNYSNFQLLPLQLLDFSAAVNNLNVGLSWTTSMETNFNGFILERSADGKGFKECATIPAKGNNSARTAYIYSDSHKDETANTLYYRLKMVDKSGSITYSAVNVVRLPVSKSNFSVTTYPNPATDQVVLTMPAEWAGKNTTAELFSTSGIKVKGLLFANTNTNERMDISQLEKGMYVVSVGCGTQKLQTKFIKN